MSDTAILELDGVVRTYVQADAKLEVIRSASLSVKAGDLVGLVGPSGAGKSTLLHVAGLLEMPDGGEVRIAGKACGDMSDGARTEVRRTDIGFVYQFHHLLPEFSALENVMIPQMLNGLVRDEATERAEQLLAMVGLRQRCDHRPGALSGGEQQRVAIARAVANAPRILLADEPTGNLDPETAAEVFEHLNHIVRGTDTAALIVTHNEALAAPMDRRLTIRDGGIHEI